MAEMTSKQKEFIDQLLLEKEWELTNDLQSYNDGEVTQEVAANIIEYLISCEDTANAAAIRVEMMNRMTDRQRNFINELISEKIWETTSEIQIFLSSNNTEVDKYTASIIIEYLLSCKINITWQFKRRKLMMNLKTIFEKWGYGHLKEEIEDLEDGYEVVINVVDRDTFNLMNDLNESTKFTVYEDCINDTITIAHS